MLIGIVYGKYNKTLLLFVINVMFFRSLFAFAVGFLFVVQVHAQERTVENRPYTDLRPFHFGVLVGAHFQDIEFENVGPQMVTNDDGTTSERIITVDQDRYETGFTVGVLGEARLGNYFAFRVAPALFFGTRHFSFHNFSQTKEDGTAIEEKQDMKTAYISTAFDLIYSAKRFNNHRPYALIGLNPKLNLSIKDDDYIKLKPFDCFLEVGLGCDFYLPFFKLRPELKFGYSLTNALDTKHVNELKDRNAQIYAGSVKSAQTKFIALTFHFE